MNKLPIDKHIRFYENQLEEMYQERKRYIDSSVRLLQKEGRLFFGRIWSIDEVKGQIILRFKNNKNERSSLPRLKVPYQLCVIAANAPASPKDFTFSYDEFRKNKTFKTSRCFPVYTFKGDDQWRFFGCEQVSMDLVSAIKDALDTGKAPLIILAEEDPPYQYLENLKDFVKNNPDNQILNSNIDLGSASWSPKKLPPHSELQSHIINLLSQNTELIIQGPPGTGKTQLISEICAHYIKENKSVCVTALTNKALGEVCEKNPLSHYLTNGQVYKTNLTSDERRKYKGLKEAKELTVSNSELLLATYYKLSEDLKDLPNKRGKFDLLIIEEASQAYLATIAGFIELGTKVLIVGDPMQMYPIILNESQVIKIHPKIDNAIKGLEVFSYTNEEISHRIIDTYRLTSDAAIQTAVFYNETLNSVSLFNNKTLIRSESNLIPKNGETIFLMHKLSTSKEMMIKSAIELANDLKLNNNSFEIAILSNLKKTVENLYDSILENNNSLNGFTIETIDRIQGMTCDICIVLVESSSQFAFQMNRFNVATSRSTRGTIFITRNIIESLQSINPLVKKFINMSTKITL